MVTTGVQGMAGLHAKYFYLIMVTAIMGSEWVWFTALLITYYLRQ